MECSICYDTCPSNIKLFCSHSYCKDCLFKWCKTGSNENCPTCRKPINFKGYSKLKDEWHAEKIENGYSRAFEEIVDSMYDYAHYLKTTDPLELDLDEYSDYYVMTRFMRRGMCYVRYLITVEEREFNKLKDAGVHPDDMYDVLSSGGNVVTNYEHMIRDKFPEKCAYYRPLHVMIC